MPISLYTGLPGNGKTALVVERLVNEAKKAERPLFACGIDGLEPGLATVLDDPRKWNDKDEAGNFIVPDGALIFVDECWKWFGHLHDASRQPNPPHVMALAEHRHRGIDFVWTSQAPNQIYPFARGLIADHHHVVRRFNTKIIDVFTWAELNEDVKSGTRRDNAQRVTRALPSAVFEKYKSAAVHTMKPKIPLRVIAFPAIVLGVIFFAYSAYGSLTAKGSESAEKPNAPQGASASAASGGGGDEEKELTPWEYSQRHLPRFASMPHTAPIYDDRAPKADPQIMCMASEAGEDVNGEFREASCLCLSEQGTRYDIYEQECRRLARHGPAYNPYREEREVRADGRQEAPGRVGTQTAPPAIVMDAPQVSGYGDVPRAERVESAADNGYSGG